MAEKEYIEREKALDFISEVEPIICMPPDNKPTFTAVKDPDMVAYLESIPAADVRPVVHGKWEQKEVFEAKGYVDELQSAFCPVCQRYHTTPYSYYSTQYNFCPNCGADMREES